jgi:hypothetical protein
MLSVIKWSTIERTFFMGHASDCIDSHARQEGDVERKGRGLCTAVEMAESLT